MLVSYCAIKFSPVHKRNHPKQPIRLLSSFICGHCWSPCDVRRRPDTFTHRLLRQYKSRRAVVPHPTSDELSCPRRMYLRHASAVPPPCLRRTSTMPPPYLLHSSAMPPPFLHRASTMPPPCLTPPQDSSCVENARTARARLPVSRTFGAGVLHSWRSGRAMDGRPRSSDSRVSPRPPHGMSGRGRRHHS